MNSIFQLVALGLAHEHGLRDDRYHLLTHQLILTGGGGGGL